MISSYLRFLELPLNYVPNLKSEIQLVRIDVVFLLEPPGGQMCLQILTQNSPMSLSLFCRLISADVRSLTISASLAR
jgi:hypothetical protein